MDDLADVRMDEDSSGITRKFATTNTYMKRSQLRKLPVDVIAISIDRGDRHRDVLVTPK